MVVQLDRDLAIALFEWSYQFMTHHDPTFQHPADVIGIDQLSGELERALTEPFDERAWLRLPWWKKALAYLAFQLRRWL